MDLEDISINDVPELAPFRFQEYLDFILDDDQFSKVEILLEKMRQLDQTLQLGSSLLLKGHLLQLPGKVCNLYQSELLARSARCAGQSIEIHQRS